MARIQIEVRDGTLNLGSIRVDGKLVDAIPHADDGEWTTYVLDVEATLAPPEHKPATHGRKSRQAELNAAKGVAPKVGTHGHRVLQAYVDDYQAGGEGLTSYEVASRLAMNLYTAAPRVTELLRAGYLIENGFGPSATSEDGATRCKLSLAAALSMHVEAPAVSGDQLTIEDVQL